MSTSNIRDTTNGEGSQPAIEKWGQVGGGGGRKNSSRSTSNIRDTTNGEGFFLAIEE